MLRLLSIKTEFNTCSMCAYLKDDSPLKGDERWICHHKCSRERFVYPDEKACKWMDEEMKKDNWLDYE